MTHESVTSSPVNQPDGNEINGLNKDLFHSAIDREIAESVTARLQSRLLEGHISMDIYSNALEALDVLTPKRNEKRYRVIGETVISPPMERTIASRLSSEAIDITAPEGMWGSLPPSVKKEIIQKSRLMVEMTSNCTVRCHFCELARKGPIESKIAFTGMENLMTDFRDGQEFLEDTIRLDALYYGTDPFDAKWRVDGMERDYRDLARSYWDIMKGRPRILYTSTAIPLGEEFRVLAFADELIRRKQELSINQYSFLRVSITNANISRAMAVNILLNALHTEEEMTDSIYFTDIRDDEIALRGAAWDRLEQEPDPWDIIGPECRDNVVITPTSIDWIVMEGASNERPSGQQRLPLSRQEGQNTVYLIPHYYGNPDHESETTLLKDIYPDTTFTRINVTPTGETREVVRDERNPHRALQRLAAALDIVELRSRKNGKQISSTEKEYLYTLFQHDISLIQKHLSMGNRNISMEFIVKKLKRDGYIPLPKPTPIEWLRRFFD